MDLAVRADGPRVAAIHFRVAVTNPPAVVGLVEDLIAQFLERFGGDVTDASGAPPASGDWRAMISRAFDQGRARFTGIFGEIELAVSSDEVFGHLKEWDSSSGS